MIIETLKELETYINNIYLVCKNKDKALMVNYFTDDFIHPYNDFSPIDVKDIYFIFFKKNIKDDVFPKFLFSVYGINYSIEVQTAFLDVRMNIEYMDQEIKNDFVDKYFKNLTQTSNDEVVEINLENFVNEIQKQT